jgi:kynureninase
VSPPDPSSARAARLSPADAADELLAWRGEFPILETSNYMISNSLGAMPRGVWRELATFADQWAARGVRAWHEGWWEMPVTVGNLLCDILGAPHGSITMHQNVSIAEAVVLSCFEFSGRRNKVVYTDMNFPSVMYVFEAQKKRGARIHVVKSDDGVTVDTQKLLDAIDETTLLVPISHVLFRSAFIQDAAAVVEKAHRVGAQVILDVYQSAGCVPVDLTKLGVDFAVGGSVKWLCGGPGAGYLYVRPDLVKGLEPSLTGWQAHQRPFEFEIGPIRYANDQFRFLNGTPHVPSLFSARSGYQIIREIGVDRIRAKSVRLVELILDEAKAAGLRVTCPANPAVRGGTVAIDVPEGERVCAELLRREIIVDYRPKAGIRVSPHFYSTEDECRAVVAAIVEITGSRGRV